MTDVRHVTKSMTSYLFLPFSCAEVGYLYVGLRRHRSHHASTQDEFSLAKADVVFALFMAVPALSFVSFTRPE